MQQYNDLIEVLSFIDTNALNANLFKKKAPIYPTSGSIKNKDVWTLTGTPQAQANNDLESINMEINLNISPHRISEDSFKIEDSILKDIVKGNIGLNCNLVLQTTQKMGDDYIINNYILEPTLDSMNIIHNSVATMNSDNYKLWFPLDSEQIGITQLIVTIDVPFLYFNGIKCSVRTEGGILKYGPFALSGNIGVRDTNTELRYPFYAAVNIKAFLDIYKSRIGSTLVDSVLDRISYATYNVSNYGHFNINTFEDIRYHEYIDVDDTEFDVVICPKYSSVVEGNFMNALNKFTYDTIIDFKEDGFRLITPSDVLTSPYTKSELSSKIDTVKRAIIDNIDIKLVIPKINNSDINDFKNIFEELYKNHLSTLKSKWDKSSAVYDRIYKGKPIDRNMFALLFIQKYFIIQTPANMTSVSIMGYNYDLNPLLSFFNDNIMKFSDFFGKDYITKYLEVMTKYPLNFFSWKFDKLNNEGTVLFKGSNINTGGRLSVDYLWPRATFIKSKGKHRKNVGNRHTNILIINDSMTKVAWKTKTRQFIGELIKENYININVLDIQDKFQLMVIKRVLKDYTHIIYYSDFEKDFKKKSSDTKKGIGTQVISFYDVYSYLRNTRQIIPRKLPLDKMVMSDYIFVEFVVTKRESIFKGKTYSERQFDFQKWGNIIREFTGKTLVQINRSNLNKLENAYPGEVLTLDVAIDQPFFCDGFKKISHYYLFIDVPDNNWSNFIGIVQYIHNELFSPFMNNEDNLILAPGAIQGLILNSFETDVGLVFSKISQIFSAENISGAVRYNSIYNESIKSFYPIPPKDSLDYIIYERIPQDTNQDRINEAVKTLIKLNKNNNLFRLGPNRFRISQLITSHNNLLKMSNYLNINNKEFKYKENILFMSFIDLWDTTIRYIEYPFK